MADVTISPLPSPATPALAAVQAESAALSATQEQLRAVLAALPSGSLLQGFVLNRDASGGVVLRTAQGDFLLQSQFFLKIGSDVVVRLTGSGAQAKAAIVTVDGLPPEAAEGVPAHEDVADVIASQQPQANAGGIVTQANTPQTATAPLPASNAQSLPVANATIIRAAQTAAPAAALPANATPAANAPLPVGTQLRVQLVNFTPAPAAQNAPEETAVPTSAPATTPLPQNAAQQIAQAPAASPQYSAYTRGLAPVPLQQPATPAAVSTPITATVLHAQADGTALLSTPLGDVQASLPGPVASLPPGSTVTLQVLAALPPATPAPASAENALPALAQGWDALQQIITQLVEIAPEAAQQLTSVTLPHIAPSMGNAAASLQNIGSGAAAFTSALATGDVRSYLGPHVVALLEAAGHGALIDRAQADFSVMRQAFFSPSGRGWQALFVPVLTEEGVRTARFYARRERGGKREKGRAPAGDTRFIVEADLSQVGPVQLDGFVKKRDGAAQFDLIVRTQSPFAEAEKNDIRALYQATSGAAGASGTLIFQDMAEFPVHPLEEMLAGTVAEVKA